MVDAPRTRASERRGLAPIRVVVGDGDAISRAFLANVLSQHADVELVATCRHAREVVGAIESHRPDLVFLEAEMPDSDAFSVVDTVGAARMPPVVFVATKRDFAVRAFDLRALDYLVKPLSRRRVEEAVNRAREHVTRERFFAVADSLLAHAPPPRADAARTDRLILRSGNRLMFVNPDEVDWVETDGNYVRLHAGTRSYRVRRTITQMESALGTEHVVRIHRRILVRLSRLRELRLKAYGLCDAVLESGVRLPVSRKYRASLQKRLGKP